MEKEITNAQLYEMLTKKIDEKFDTYMKHIQKENIKIKKTVERTKREVDRLKGENRELQDRVLLLEKRVRKNNVAIFGLKVREETLLDDFVNQVEQLLNITISTDDISSIYQPKSKNNPPIIVEFIRASKKAEIFRQIKPNIRKLKQARVYIANDLSKEERLIGKFLRGECERARRENKTAKIVKGQLIIDGDVYGYDSILQLENNSGGESDAETEYSEGEIDEQREEVNNQQLTEDKALETSGTHDIRKTLVAVNPGQTGNKRKQTTPSPRYKLRQKREETKKRTGGKQ